MKKRIPRKSRTFPGDSCMTYIMNKKYYNWNMIPITADAAIYAIGCLLNFFKVI